MSLNKNVIDKAIEEFKKHLLESESSTFSEPRCRYIFNHLHKKIYFPHHQQLFESAVLLLLGFGALGMLFAEMFGIPRGFRAAVAILSILASLILCPADPTE